MKIEERWSDCGVFIVTMQVERLQNNELKEIVRMFSLKNCFTKKQAAQIIVNNFPDVKEVIRIEYFENSLMLKEK